MSKSILIYFLLTLICDGNRREKLFPSKIPLEYFGRSKFTRFRENIKLVCKRNVPFCLFSCAQQNFLDGKAREREKKREFIYINVYDIPIPFEMVSYFAESTLTCRRAKVQNIENSLPGFKLISES